MNKSVSSFLFWVVVSLIPSFQALFNSPLASCVIPLNSRKLKYSNRLSARNVSVYQGLNVPLTKRVSEEDWSSFQGFICYGTFPCLCLVCCRTHAAFDLIINTFFTSVPPQTAWLLPCATDWKQSELEPGQRMEGALISTAEGSGLC